MFLYQTKINGKDGLVAISETQDAGKQAPLFDTPVLAAYESEGALTVGTISIPSSDEEETDAFYSVHLTEDGTVDSYTKLENGYDFSDSPWVFGNIISTIVKDYEDYSIDYAPILNRKIEIEYVDDHYEGFEEVGTLSTSSGWVYKLYAGSGETKDGELLPYADLYSPNYVELPQEILENIVITEGSDTEFELVDTDNNTYTNATLTLKDGTTCTGRLYGENSGPAL